MLGRRRSLNGDGDASAPGIGGRREANSSADELQVWEAIIVEWRNPSQAILGRGVPDEVRATQLVEISSLVASPRE